MSTASTSAVAGPSSSQSQPQTHPSPPSRPSPEAARQIAEARVALEAQMTNIGSSLDSSLRSRAANLHANSAQLDKQQKDVVKETANLRKETEKLKKLANEGARKVKELGNVQNWAEMLERDFLVLEETLRLANRGSESGSGSGSEWETDGSESGDEDGRKEGRDKMNVDGEALQQLKVGVLDGEGDVTMDGTEGLDKGKGKEELIGGDVSTEHQPDTAGGSSTATIGSGTDPSSSSIHTSNSVHTSNSAVS